MKTADRATDPAAKLYTQFKICSICAGYKYRTNFHLTHAVEMLQVKRIGNHRISQHLPSTYKEQHQNYMQIFVYEF